MMKEKKTSNTHYYFPRELITEIISWLPVKSLLRFKCVSKPWCTLIKDPVFIKLHLHRSLEANSNATFAYCRRSCNIFYYYSNNYNPHKSVIKFRSDSLDWVLVSSCNGLICFKQRRVIVGDHMQLHLYNPATRAYKTLPHVDYSYLGEEKTNYTAVLALGYDSVSDDYKLLRVDEVYDFNRKSRKADCRTLLYSLKRDTWEIVENIRWSDDIRRLTASSTSVFANNSLHWLNPKGNGEIWCFDVSTKTHYNMHVPKEFSRYSPRLTAFKGKLCIVTHCLDIWILNKYDDTKYWTRLFHNTSYGNKRNTSNKIADTFFTGVECLQPKDGRNFVILGIRTIINTEQREWIRCDLETGEAKKIHMPFLSEDLELANLYQWVESLVPLV